MAVPLYIDVSQPAKAVWQIDPATGIATPANSSSSPQFVRAAPYTQLGYQQLVEPAASAPLPSIPASATVATIQNNGTVACRWRPDGATTAPTASTGQVIAAGATLTLDDGAAGLASARFIRTAAGVTLDICYFS